MNCICQVLISLRQSYATDGTAVAGPAAGRLAVRYHLTVIKKSIQLNARITGTQISYRLEWEHLKERTYTSN